MHTRESGRTMIETLAVIGLMGIMTIGAVTIYTRARTNLLRMESISHINELADDIQTLFSGRSSYDGLTISYLERMGAIKTNKDPFGEEFSVRPVLKASQFSISYQKVSRQNCIYFGSLQWESVTSILINGAQAQLDEMTLQCLDGTINTFTLYFQ
ncbi:MAG: type II secretion system protein [Alphaproteobacteria bacterium]|nr:type II secretion system protein [Alphaproteobacteria bacterium]